MMEKISKRKLKSSSISNIFIFLIGFTFIIPSGNFHLFSGIPLSDSYEFVGLIILLPLIVSSRLRRIFNTTLKSMNVFIYKFVFWGCVLGLGLKLIILFSGVNQGFSACYLPIVELMPENRCEHSYENPLYLQEITRFDKTLEFTSSRRGISTTVQNIKESNTENWHLSFFNSIRFNYYSNIEGNIWRRRLPFSVYWFGLFDNPNGKFLEIIYTGEGLVSIGEESFDLPPSYLEEAIIRIPINNGIQSLAVHYIFDDGYRISDTPVPGPYARFKGIIVSGDKNSEQLSLEAIQPSIYWRILGRLIDIILGFVWLSIFSAYFRLLKQHLVAILFMLALLFGTIRFFKWVEIQDLVQIYQYAVFVILCMVLIYLSSAPKRGKTVVAFFIFSIIASIQVYIAIGDFEQIIYHGAGDDWLTYESFGRSILETRSLEAGEKVFKHSILTRYLLFFEHLLLGDGDGWTSIFLLSALYFGIFYFFNSILSEHRYRIQQKAFFILIEILLLLMVNLEVVNKFVYKDASEVHPWILLSIILSFLLFGTNENSWKFGVILLGISGITRLTHIPALLTVFLIFIVFRIWKSKGGLKLSIYLFLILLIIMLLPLFHNIYYGGEFEFFRESREISINADLTPDVWIGAIDNSQFWNLLFQRLALIFQVSDDYPGISYILAFHGLQIVWAVLIVYCLLFWKSISSESKFLLLIPMIYLGVFLYFRINTYYYRNIVAGHLAMGLVSAYFFRDVVRFSANLVKLETFKLQNS